MQGIFNGGPLLLRGIHETIQLYESGLSCAEIVESMARNHSTVNRHLAPAGQEGTLDLGRLCHILRFPVAVFAVTGFINDKSNALFGSCYSYI